MEIAGIAVAMIPLLTTGIVARLCLKQNYLTVCGVIAGSMTDPPALAFANSQAESEAASTAYAGVYPLTMILRIIAAQAIIFLPGRLCHLTWMGLDFWNSIRRQCAVDEHRNFVIQQFSIGQQSR